MTEQQDTQATPPIIFYEGDIVRNINPKSDYYNKVGAFKRYWSDLYTFPYEGRGCDVYYPGVRDLYDRPETAQSVSDLVKVDPQEYLKQQT